jgi:hypothetical protein
MCANTRATLAYPRRQEPEGGMNFIKFIYAEAGQVAYAHAGMISYLKDPL